MKDLKLEHINIDSVKIPTLYMVLEIMSICLPFVVCMMSFITCFTTVVHLDSEDLSPIVTLLMWDFGIAGLWGLTLIAKKITAKNITKNLRKHVREFDKVLNRNRIKTVEWFTDMGLIKLTKNIKNIKIDPVILTRCVEQIESNMYDIYPKSPIYEVKSDQRIIDCGKFVVYLNYMDEHVVVESIHIPMRNISIPDVKNTDKGRVWIELDKQFGKNMSVTYDDNLKEMVLMNPEIGECWLSQSLMKSIFKADFFEHLLSWTDTRKIKIDPEQDFRDDDTVNVVRDKHNRIECIKMSLNHFTDEGDSDNWPIDDMCKFRSGWDVVSQSDPDDDIRHTLLEFGQMKCDVIHVRPDNSLTILVKINR